MDAPQSRWALSEKQRILLTAPLWMGSEILSHVTPWGRRERRERMTSVALHESGHALVDLVHPDKCIRGFHISDLQTDTRHNLCTLFPNNPFWKCFKGDPGFVVTELLQHAGEEDTDLDVIHQLAGLAAEYGNSISKIVSTKSVREWEDFHALALRIDQKFAEADAPCGDDIIVDKAKRIIASIHEVFASSEMYGRSIHALAKYMKRHGTAEGKATHTNLMKVVEKEGLDAAQRQELLSRLQSIDVDAFLW